MAGGRHWILGGVGGRSVGQSLPIWCTYLTIANDFWSKPGWLVCGWACQRHVNFHLSHNPPTAELRTRHSEQRAFEMKLQRLRKKKEGTKPKAAVPTPALATTGAEQAAKRKKEATERAKRVEKRARGGK